MTAYAKAPARRAQLPGREPRDAPDDRREGGGSTHGEARTGTTDDRRRQNGRGARPGRRKRAAVRRPKARSDPFRFFVG